MTTSFPLSPSQLQSRLASGSPPLVLDVREPSEYAGGRVAGAQLLPLGRLKERADVLPRDREIVCVCQSGRRSAEAAKQLTGLGFPAVTELQGGMNAWAAGSLPMQRDDKAPWALERQVRLVAGVLILLGLSLSHIWPPAIALAWFVPAGLVFAALTDSCAMGMLIARMPWNRRSAPACDFSAVRTS